MDFTWLHLSDIHVKDTNYDSDVVLRSLIKSMPALSGRYGSADAIIVSGDIAFSGKKAEYEKATEFFDRLLDATGCRKERLVVVPGNHDIDRGGGNGLARTLQDGEEADRYFGRNGPMLHVEMRLRNYRTWYNSYFENIDEFDSHTTCLAIRQFDIRGKSIALLPINTSTFCIDDHDHGKLWVGRRSLDNASERLSRIAPDLSIAVMHHPLDWLNLQEVQQVRAFLQERFNIVHSGHLHLPTTGQYADRDGSVLYIAAGAAYQTRKYPNSATFLSITNGGVKVCPICYMDAPREVWTTDTSQYPQESDFSKVFSINSLTGAVHKPPLIVTKADILNTADASTDVKALKVDLERDLFLTPITRRLLYVEPNIMAKPQETWWEEKDNARIEVGEIVTSKKSWIIETRSEYGGTTLCRRLALECARTSHKVTQRDARVMPNYRRKLDLEFLEEIKAGVSFTLILDNFDSERDEKLLKELAQIEIDIRIIAVETNRGVRPTRGMDLKVGAYEFQRVYLWSLSRNDVRILAEEVLDTADEVLLSSAVDKVYGDLLALCIPLTPVNVIMYLRIIDREGDFQPLNRVEIGGRYVSQMMQTSSDLYKDTFSAKNKIDFISSLTFDMFEKRMQSFSDKEWHDYVSEYQKRTLSEFDGKEFLEQLIATRILARWGGRTYFRYSFYFSYFLGRYVAYRPSVIEKFFESQAYMMVDNLVDVITGISSDNERIVTALSEKLEDSLDQFSRRYVPEDFDPFEGATWPDSEKEDERLWGPIAAAIEAGPKKAKEIDAIKSSIVAEARTADQELKFSEFIELENIIFRVASLLSDALRNADDVDGKAKMRAYRAILRTHRVGMQIGALYAPKLARNKYVKWGSILYIDFHKVAEGKDPDSAEVMFKILRGLSRAVATKVAEEIGAHKLSGVFRAVEAEGGVMDFLSFVNVCCIISARGPRWADTLAKSIERADKNSFYLNAMLGHIMSVIRNELMQGKDLEVLKRAVAQIQAKRSYGKQAPGAKAISKMLSHLENIDHFHKE